MVCAAGKHLAQLRAAPEDLPAWSGLLTGLLGWAVVRGKRGFPAAGKAAG